VIDGFLILITQQTFLVMLKIPASKTICSPSLIVDDQPHEKMAFVRSLGSPNTIPWTKLNGALKETLID
jgi:hypothetical protein